MPTIRFGKTIFTSKQAFDDFVTFLAHSSLDANGDPQHFG